MYSYYKDVYLDTLETTIIERKDHALVLEDTIFFPGGGGQAPDRGTINGIQVVDVKEVDGVIYHYVKEEIEGDAALLELDMDKRIDDIQHHSAEHILSGLIKKHYDGNNKGFHMGSEYITIDIDIKFTKEMLHELEILSNEVVYKNIDITYSTDTSTVRKELTVEENARVVNIEGVDSVGCCGTHANKTGEICIIKILKSEKNKEYTRIYFKAGKRALKDYQMKSEVMDVLNRNFSSDDTTLIEKYNIEKEKQNQLKSDYLDLNKLYMDDVMKRTKGNVFIFDILSDFNYVQKKLIKKLDSYFIIYSKSEHKIMLHANCSNLSARDCFKNIKAYHGRGGGSDKVASGVFDNDKDGLSFLESIRK